MEKDREMSVCGARYIRRERFSTKEIKRYRDIHKYIYIYIYIYLDKEIKRGGYNNVYSAIYIYIYSRY